jgi:hypothetical protein
MLMLFFMRIFFFALLLTFGSHNDDSEMFRIYNS